MRRKLFTAFTYKDFFLAISMLLVIALVLLFGNISLYKKGRAFVQTPNGVRIEAEDMKLEGTVTQDQNRSFIQF